jgi:hypothetical protein
VRQQGHDGRAGQRDRGESVKRKQAASSSTASSGRSRGFELDLDGATLLGRRHGGRKAGVEGLSLTDTAATKGTGSPMRTS